MKSITDYMIKLQELTQQNLDILKTINDSFFTKYDHLTVKVGENHYVIPSFLSLESKINSLQSNFNNLVDSPAKGEAFFNMDGNSRSIVVRKYEETPNPISLAPVDEFGFEPNNIFKDFVTPIPFINLSLQSIPNDITQVLVKKIVPLSHDLKSLFKSYLYNETETLKNQNQTKIYFRSIPHQYKDLYKVLANYTKDVDYIEYDSRMDLPIRKNIGSSTYVIEKIVDDWIDDNLVNFMTLKFHNDLDDALYSNNLKYKLFDETIEVPLKVGDQLVTYEGNAKLEITDIKSNINTITVKVLHGEFLNLIEYSANTNESNIPDSSKIKFYSPIDFDNDKHIKVPLEEDQLIFVSISPLNNRMNIQAPWGSGLIVDTYSLMNGEKNFKQYYDENVRNVGDILFEITSIMSNNLTQLTSEEYQEMTNLIPVIDKNNIVVTQINSHLNDSETVKNIRSLYTQKKQQQQKLNTVRDEISTISARLSNVSFENISGVKTIYEDQLKELRNEESALLTSINKLINEIALSVNNSEIPLENAKYRIRGFFDYMTFLKDSKFKNHVKGIRVQYRYKNVNRAQGSAFTINDKFVFSDWNNMNSFDLNRIPTYDGGYKFSIESNNDSKNEPSFNQIDIPISQGETVDIRLKLVYDFGAPLIEAYSAWSEIVNIEFPQEFLQNVSVMSIIDENEKERESDRFKSILNQEGVTKHTTSSIQDQDVLYYHKTDDIASGFYTQERRVIPLKDKLVDMSNTLQQLYDEVSGQSSLNLKVSIINGSTVYDLQPYQINHISVLPYRELYNNKILSNTSMIGYEWDNNGDIASTFLTIVLKNDSDHSMKLFSLFPGDRDTEIHKLKNTKITKSDIERSYQYENNGVWIEYTKGTWDETFNVYTQASSLQKGNQFIYFRISDINDGTPFYTDKDYYTPYTNEDERQIIPAAESLLSSDINYYKPGPTASFYKGNGAWMYPIIREVNGLQMESNIIGSYYTLNPGDKIEIPVVFSYRLNRIDMDKTIKNYVSKTMSFEVQTSLYRDPVAYTFKVTAKYETDMTEKAIQQINQQTTQDEMLTKYRPTIK